mgnify:CR=1 FL=1
MNASPPLSLLQTIRGVVRRHTLALAVLWTLGILVALSFPTPDLPDASASLDLDKAAHAVLFAGLGVLWMRALQPSGDTPRHAWTRAAGLLGAGLAFAALTEVYQAHLLTGRTGDPYDAVADGLGLLAAVVAYATVRTLQATRTRHT